MTLCSPLLLHRHADPKSQPGWEKHPLNHPHKHCNPVSSPRAVHPPGAAGRWGQHPPSSPRHGLGAVRWRRFPGTHRQPGETGQGPAPADGMLSFHTAPVRGRAAAKPSAALFPTLVAIKKCKFILLLRPPFSPRMQNDPRAERPHGAAVPGSVGAAGAGKNLLGGSRQHEQLQWSQSQGGPGQHAMPRRAGEALGCGFPLGPALSIPGESAEGFAPGGKS